MTWDDLLGKAFGKLVCEALERRGRKLMARCLCACGRVTYAEPSPLAAGKRTSCGCATGGDRRSAKFKNRPPVV